MKFKIGDKVKCINDGDNESHYLKKGKIYTIINSKKVYDSNRVYLKEIGNNYDWYEWRFELAIPKHGLELEIEELETMGYRPEGN